MKTTLMILNYSCFCAIVGGVDKCFVLNELGMGAGGHADSCKSFADRGITDGHLCRHGSLGLVLDDDEGLAHILFDPDAEGHGAVCGVSATLQRSGFTEFYEPGIEGDSLHALIELESLNIIKTNVGHLRDEHGHIALFHPTRGNNSGAFFAPTAS